MSPEDYERQDIEVLNEVRPYCFESDREEQWFKVGLQYGLDAADKEPLIHWISVNDDLPCNHEELIVKDSKGRPETKKVIIRYLRKGPSGKMVPKIMDCMMSTFAAGEGSDKFVWHFFCKEYIITHWMPIPELGIKEE